MDVLTNKSYKTYSRLSRYSVVPTYYSKLINNTITGTSTYLSQDTPYETYTVKAGDTYDSISLAYYNNPTYFWIICSFNRIGDCFSKPRVGRKLAIPTISKIEFNN